MKSNEQQDHEKHDNTGQGITEQHVGQHLETDMEGTLPKPTAGPSVAQITEQSSAPHAPEASDVPAATNVNSATHVQPTTKPQDIGAGSQSSNNAPANSGTNTTPGVDAPIDTPPGDGPDTLLHEPKRWNA